MILNWLLFGISILSSIGTFSGGIQLPTISYIVSRTGEFLIRVNKNLILMNIWFVVPYFGRICTTKSQNINVSRLVLQFILPDPFYGSDPSMVQIMGCRRAGDNPITWTKNGTVYWRIYCEFRPRWVKGRWPRRSSWRHIRFSDYIAIVFVFTVYCVLGTSLLLWILCAYLLLLLSLKTLSFTNVF